MSAGVLACLLGMIALSAYVLRMAYPASEAVRLRNALLLQPSTAADFAWSPANVPADYRCERLPASADFIAVVRQLGVGAMAGDWDKALALAGHLTENSQEKGAIQADPFTTYRRIREGYGYCADYVKAFLALAHAARLFARQWAFSFDGFGGHGHTFVEVFDQARGKWLFIDVHNNFHVADAASAEPLSALEFRDYLKGGTRSIHIVPNGPGRPGFVHDDKCLDYFRRGADEWYLWWGNAVFTYYAHPLVIGLSRISRVLGHLAANLLGLQPRLRILVTPENSAQADRLWSLRRRLRWCGALFVSLTVLLALQLAWPQGRRGNPAY